MAAAICSISPTQRQPLAAAAAAAPSQRLSRPGWERAHSSSSTDSTPSARASARAASSNAADPLVQDAYAIFTADADRGHLTRGGRRDRVGVQVEAAEPGHLPGYVQGRVRRADRDNNFRTGGHLR